VVGKERGDVLGVVVLPRLQPFGCAAMQAGALPDEDLAVRSLLGERVLEAVLGLWPAATFAKQVEALQLMERAAQIVGRPGHPLQPLQPELPPQHSGRQQYVVTGVWKSIDAGEDHLLDGRRDGDVHSVVEPIAILVVDERSRIEQRPDQLLEVEGVSLRILEDPPLQGRQAGRRPR